MTPKEAPYGTWESPITVDTLTSDVSTLDDVIVDQNARKIYLLEGRSNGRNVLVEIADDGKARDVLPEPYTIGTMIYGYGGSAVELTSDSKIIFADKKTGATHLLDPATGQIESLFSDKDYAYCDFHGSPADPRWMLALQEEHKDPTPATEKHSVAVIDLESKKAITLVEGNDFYWAARFSPKGDRICWLTWNHPEMPWQGCTLHVADFADGAISNTKTVAGSPEGRAVLEPRWGKDGSLYFTDDTTGFSQPQVLKPGAESPTAIKLPGLDKVDFMGTNLMRMGASSYQLLTPTLGIFTTIDKAQGSLIAVDLATNTTHDLGLSYGNIAPNSLTALSPTEFVFVATPTTEVQALYLATLSHSPISATVTRLRRSADLDLPPEIISIPQPMSCPRTHGDVPGDVHFFYMPPTNPSFTAPPNTLPPLILYCHGGPTGLVTPALWPDFQFWTSRGYAALLLNYGGSVGYGRDYRRILDGRWGVLDSDDAASAVTHLTSTGLADASRVGIYGLSAGGYLVLKAAADHAALFAGGVSLFGVADTKILADTTHKFESRYLDRLLFPSGVHASASEQAQTHVARSPVSLAHRISAPILQLQGTADIVVPPAQATLMEGRIREAGGTVETVWFEGEGHAVWKGEAMRRSVRAQEAWWRKTLVRE